MEEREALDDAILTAVEHTTEAEHDLLHEPVGTDRARVLAEHVEHRAEDVDVLATEARHAAEVEVAPDDAPPG